MIDDTATTKHEADGGAEQSPIRVKKFRDLKDKYLGPVGTPERDEYEFELSLELLSEKIKALRKEQHLTQTELGERLGVQKAQISKLERNAANVTVDTLLKVFRALHTTVNISLRPLTR